MLARYCSSYPTILFHQMEPELYFISLLLLRRLAPTGLGGLALFVVYQFGVLKTAFNAFESARFKTRFFRDNSDEYHFLSATWAVGNRSVIAGRNRRLARHGRIS